MKQYFHFMATLYKYLLYTRTNKTYTAFSMVTDRQPTVAEDKKH